MDKGVVVEEESQPKTDSGASASKSLGSLVQINSIAIEITGAMEEIKSPVHEHFSIRGYVADMRKKDCKTCLPFTSEGGNDGGVDHLPPLFVPTFRWWRCSNCTPGVSSEKMKQPVIYNSDTVCKSGSVRHRDEESNDLIKNLANSAKNVGGGKKPETDIRDENAGNRCPNMQEGNQLPIRDKTEAADASDTGGVERPPCTVGELNNVSSASDDASRALPCKRKPKLRSLADIMVEEKKSTSDNPKPRSASSSGVQVTSTETEPFLSPQLESDVLSHIAKASLSSQRKRKIALDEDRGLFRTVQLSGLTKKTRGPVLDADRTCKRLDITEQESEENASTKSNSLNAAKFQLVKLRKAKALDNSKKPSQTQTDDGIVLTRDLHKTNASHTEDLEQNINFVQTNVTKIRHEPNSVEEMGQFSRFFMSGNQTERISILPNSERQASEANRGHVLTPPYDSMPEDPNDKGKVALDLSLNSFKDVEMNFNDQPSAGTRRYIPDLNEAFPIKAAVTQGKQLPSFSEKRDSSFHKILDNSVSCCNEPMDLEIQHGVSNAQNENGKKTCGSTDDIPMEIVELLAKNQHERALGNSSKHLMCEEIRYPPIYTDGTRNTMNFQFPNQRSVVNVGSSGILGIPVNFSQLNSCSRDSTTKPQHSQFRLFSSFAPSEQRKTQFSGSSSSIIAGARIGDRTELYWPPRRDNEPFSLGINQNQCFKTSNAGMPIPMPMFTDKYGRGKTISDINEIERNKSLHDGVSIRKARIDSNSRSVGSSMDPYSNDAIPAMQLLSLMDQGITSHSSFKVGQKNHNEKPLSPCNHRPQVNGKENQNSLSGSLFSQSNQFKDFPKLGSGIIFPSESSKKASSKSQGQVPLELNNSKAIHLEGSGNVVIKEAKSNPPLTVCTLNKNPADFSFPDARNKLYTISARDMKPKRKNPPKEKPRSVIDNGRKRQRVKKDGSGKRQLQKLAEESCKKQ